MYTSGKLWLAYYFPSSVFVADNDGYTESDNRTLRRQAETLLGPYQAPIYGTITSDVEPSPVQTLTARPRNVPQALDQTMTPRSVAYVSPLWTLIWFIFVLIVLCVFLYLLFNILN